MRSRTELVTTTFIDSEEDSEESDDESDDWKPDTSNNASKKRKHNQKQRRQKRKSLNLTLKKQKIEASSSSSYSNIKEFLESDDDDDESSGSYSYTNYPNYLASSQSQHQKLFSNDVNVKPLSSKVIAEQSMPNQCGIFQLYLYKKDLDKNYRTNLNLCLWRRDGSSLLQKYIRVKTGNSEDFIFTSSSVYSNWDDRRRKDFAIIAVKCFEENNRRVTILNISDLHSLAEDIIRIKQLKLEKNEGDDSSSSKEIVDNADDLQSHYEDEEKYEYFMENNDDDDDDDIENDDNDPHLESESQYRNFKENIVKSEVNEVYEDKSSGCNELKQSNSDD